MRGKPTLNVSFIAIVRNIPAYAGKTARIDYVCETLKEHPRVCGENSDIASVKHLQEGTSPRMRGKRPEISPNRHSRGNIPAYAGKT